MKIFDETLTKSLDDFMESYKIVDTEEIYSNGIELVPIFRVKQWEEYNNKDKEIERLKEEYVMLQNASDKVEEEKDKEIERLNNILDTLMQDMALLNATNKKEIKPKYVFDRIATLRGVDKE